MRGFCFGALLALVAHAPMCVAIGGLNTSSIYTDFEPTKLSVRDLAGWVLSKRKFKYFHNKRFITNKIHTNLRLYVLIDKYSR